jgi:hypothetical protein
LPDALTYESMAMQPNLPALSSASS